MSFIRHIVMGILGLLPLASLEARTSLHPDLYSVERVTDQGFEQLEFTAHKRMLLITEPVNTPVPFTPSDSFRVALDPVNAHEPEFVGEALPVNTRASGYDQGSIQRGDFDGDGLTDLLTGAGSEYLVIFGGESNIPAAVKYLTLPDSLPYVSDTGSFVLGDVDQDGITEFGYYEGGVLNIAYSLSVSSVNEIGMVRVPALDSTNIKMKELLARDPLPASLIEPSKINSYVDPMRGSLGLSLDIPLPVSEVMLPDLSIQKAEAGKRGMIGSGWILGGIPSIQKCNVDSFDKQEVTVGGYCYGGRHIKHVGRNHGLSEVSLEGEYDLFASGLDSFIVNSADGHRLYFGGDARYGDVHPLYLIVNKYTGKEVVLDWEAGSLLSIKYEDVQVEFEYFEQLGRAQSWPGMADVESKILKNINIYESEKIISRSRFYYDYNGSVVLNGYQRCSFEDSEENCLPLYSFDLEKISFNKSIFNANMSGNEFMISSVTAPFNSGLSTTPLILQFGRVANRDDSDGLITDARAEMVKLFPGHESVERTYNSYSHQGDETFWRFLPTGGLIHSSEEEIFSLPRITMQQGHGPDSRTFPDFYATLHSNTESSVSRGRCISHNGSDNGTVAVYDECYEYERVYTETTTAPTIGFPGSERDSDSVRGYERIRNDLRSNLALKAIDLDGDSRNEVLSAYVYVSSDKAYLSTSYFGNTPGGLGNVAESVTYVPLSITADRTAEVEVAGPFNLERSLYPHDSIGKKSSFIIKVKRGSSKYYKVDVTKTSVGSYSIKQENFTTQGGYEIFNDGYVAANLDGDAYTDFVNVSKSGTTVLYDLVYTESGLEFSNSEHYPALAANSVSYLGRTATNAFPFDFNSDGVHELIVEGNVYAFENNEFLNYTGQLPDLDLKCRSIKCLKSVDLNGDGNSHLLELLSDGRIALHSPTQQHLRLSSVKYDGIELLNVAYADESFEKDEMPVYWGGYIGHNEVAHLDVNRVSEVRRNLGALGWDIQDYKFFNYKISNNIDGTVFDSVVSRKYHSDQVVENYSDISNRTLIQYENYSIGVAPETNKPYMSEITVSIPASDYDSSGNLYLASKVEYTPVESVHDRDGVIFKTITYDVNESKYYNVEGGSFEYYRSIVNRELDAFSRLKKLTESDGVDTKVTEINYHGDNNDATKVKTHLESSRTVSVNGEVITKYRTTPQSISNYIPLHVYSHDGDELLEKRTTYDYRSKELRTISEHAHPDNPYIDTLPDRSRTLFGYDQGLPSVKILSGVSAHEVSKFDTWGNVKNRKFSDGTEVTYKLNSLGRVDSMSSNTSEGFEVSAVRCDEACVKGAYLRVVNTDSTTKREVIKYLDILGKQVGEAKEIADGTLLYSYNDYDSKGRIRHSFDGVKDIVPLVPTEPSAAYEYDGNNLISQVRLKKNFTDNGYAESQTSISYILNAEGELEKSVVDGSSNEIVDGISISSNARSKKTVYTRYNFNVKSITHPSGVEYRYSYNYRGQVEKVIVSGKHATSDDYSQTFELEYDNAGNLVRSVRPGRGDVKYTYSPWGDLVREEFAGGGYKTYSYDKVGRLYEETSHHAGGNIHKIYRYGYYPDTGKLQYVYDMKGSSDTLLENASKVREYTYYSNGLVDTVLELRGGEYHKFDTDYDEKHRIKSFDIKDANDDMSMARSVLNYGNLVESGPSRLVSVELSIPGTAELYNSTVWQLSGHDELGRINEQSYFGGSFKLEDQRGIYTNDLSYRELTKEPESDNPLRLAGESIYWDVRGNPRLKAAPAYDESNDALTLEYDNDGRLVSESGMLGGQSVTRKHDFDDFGNFVYKDLIENLYQYSSSDESESTDVHLVETSSLGSISYEEAVGDIESGRINRLSEYEISYTPTGRVSNIERATDGYSVSFIYGPGESIEKIEYSDGRSIVFFDQFEVVRGPEGHSYRYSIQDGVVIQRGADIKEYVLFKDARGSIRSVWSPSGESIIPEPYDGFGGQNSPLNDDYFAVTDQGYTGHIMLRGLPFVFMNARLYSTELGRFTSIDPVFDGMYRSGGLNGYSYVTGSPYRYSDPSGKYLVPMTDQQLSDIGYHAQSVYLEQILSDRNMVTRLQQSSIAYNAGSKGLSSGDIVNLRNGDYQITSTQNSANGFQAVAFLSSEGKVDVAFAGTDPDQVADLITDAGIAVAYLNSQFDNAVDFAAGNNASHVTGHSLGGGLASYAALELGIEATTFNAPGLHWLNLVGYNPKSFRNIVNYRSTTDLLSIYVALSPSLVSPGKDVFLDNAGYHGIQPMCMSLGVSCY